MRHGEKERVRGWVDREGVLIRCVVVNKPNKKNKKQKQKKVCLERACYERVVNNHLNRPTQSKKKDSHL